MIGNILQIMAVITFSDKFFFLWFKMNGGSVSRFDIGMEWLRSDGQSARGLNRERLWFDTRQSPEWEAEKQVCHEEEDGVSGHALTQALPFPWMMRGKNKRNKEVLDLIKLNVKAVFPCMCILLTVTKRLQPIVHHSWLSIAGKEPFGAESICIIAPMRLLPKTRVGDIEPTWQNCCVQ